MEILCAASCRERYQRYATVREKRSETSFLFSSFSSFLLFTLSRLIVLEGGREKERERDHKTTDKGGYGFRILSSWSDILTDSFLPSFSTLFHSIAATAVVAIANNVGNLFPFFRNFFFRLLRTKEI